MKSFNHISVSFSEPLEASLRFLTGEVLNTHYRLYAFDPTTRLADFRPIPRHLAGYGRNDLVYVSVVCLSLRQMPDIILDATRSPWSN